MKSSISFAGIIAAALAGKDIGPWTYSTEKEIVLYNNEGVGTPKVDPTIIWTLNTYSAFDEDAGKEYFRLWHKLEAQIKPTDTVTFEIAFTSKS